MRFIREHPFLRSFTPPSFLPAQFFDPRLLRVNFPLLGRLDFIEQQPPRDESVEPLLPRRLAFHLQARRPVQQHHASRSFVYVLAAVPARAHKTLLQVSLANAERSHAARQLILFFRAYCERAHEFLMQGTVADGRVSIFNSARALYAFCSESPQTKTGTAVAGAGLLQEET